MKTLNLPRFVLISLCVVTCLLVLSLVSGQHQTVANANGLLQLKAPPFVDVAYASKAQAPTLSFSTEAGISAYFHAPISITISSVASVYRTIEVSTTDYIIGSVPIPNYPETEDVHVYVNHDGWVLAYYLNTDSSGKIFDWLSYSGTTISSTKLKNVLAIIAGSAGSPFSSPTYYDFRYPNATNLMLIAEANDTDNQFTVQLPSSFAYYERSWSLYNNPSCNGCPNPSYFTLDGVTVGSACGGCTNEGDLIAPQILPDTTHTISVLDDGGLAITYRVP